MDFKTEAERRKHLIENADHFTVVRYLGPRNGYERHEQPTLPEAEGLAQQKANEAGRPYGIYAVKGIHDTWVMNVHPQRT